MAIYVLIFLAMYFLSGVASSNIEFIGLNVEPLSKVGISLAGTALVGFVRGWKHD